MTASLSELTSRVAEHTVDWDMEMGIDWEKACLIDGLLATGEQPERTREIVDRCIETQTSEGQFSYGSLDPLHLDWAAEWTIGEYQSVPDPAAIGHGVLELYDRTGDDYYLDAARKQIEYLRDVERTSEGGIPQQRGELSLAVDGLWMVCPFLARYGVLADDPDAIDDAIKQFEVQRKHLQDPHTGLFRHTWMEQPNSYVQSSFWSRGIGWAICALVDTIEYVPDDHEGHEVMAEMLQEACSAMVDLQDDTGFWHNIVDDHEEPLETSGTLMAAYAFKRGLELGVLEGEEYAAAAERAMTVCKGVVDEDGEVRRVALVPGGPEAPIGVTLHGQGLFLMAASCFE
ncbi:glycoside hydrolase family 88 protein [Halobacterium wangiae]|uniref:glycoside hydrolase family 88 protein n=1 Tax=Halobacterium wangiae TaxID=2902623 RepID=UPI001E35CF57|nr:glycoside hydrolase family 88 protein [Halobacterium wangiae]